MGTKNVLASTASMQSTKLTVKCTSTPTFVDMPALRVQIQSGNPLELGSVSCSLISRELQNVMDCGNALVEVSICQANKALPSPGQRSGDETAVKIGQSGGLCNAACGS